MTQFPEEYVEDLFNFWKNSRRNLWEFLETLLEEITDELLENVSVERLN